MKVNDPIKPQSIKKIRYSVANCFHGNKGLGPGRGSKKKIDEKVMKKMSTFKPGAEDCVNISFIRPSISNKGQSRKSLKIAKIPAPSLLSKGDNMSNGDSVLTEFTANKGKRMSDFKITNMRRNSDLQKVQKVSKPSLGKQNNDIDFSNRSSEVGLLSSPRRMNTTYQKNKEKEESGKLNLYQSNLSEQIIEEGDIEFHIENDLVRNKKKSRKEATVTFKSK